MNVTVIIQRGRWYKNAEGHRWGPGSHDFRRTYETVHNVARVDGAMTWNERGVPMVYAPPSCYATIERVGDWRPMIEYCIHEPECLDDQRPCSERVDHDARGNDYAIIHIKERKVTT